MTTKEKKILAYLGIAFSSGAILSAIDRLVGVSFNDVSVVVVFIHKLTYVLWGSALGSLATRVTR